MLMSIVEELRSAAIYPELSAKRVLLSGLTSRCGVDIARAFAERSTRLVIRAAESSTEIDAISEILAQNAQELQLFTTDDIEDDRSAVAFAQGSAQQAFGGLEAAINLIEIHPADLAGRETQDAIETLVSEKLLAPMMSARVIANRMQLTLTPGTILYVVRAPDPQNAEQLILLEIVRMTLATMVREEAAKWADKGICINAIAPATDIETFEPALIGEPDIAALALYLASEKGRQLSGHLFDSRQQAH